MSGSSHGHTLAAWTGVIISFIGFCVAGVFMVMANVVGFWAGMVITVAGAAVGGIMHLMGLGQKRMSRAAVEQKTANAT
ncbi:HGxxPAAW family protein [Streptomyces albidoflavus]